jgi:hypothetical protein
MRTLSEENGSGSTDRDGLSERLIGVAVERGIIDGVQAGRLRHLALELEGRVAADSSAHPAEARRGFTSVSVAYTVGALLVVFALAWFLVDRWKDLGTAAILATSLGYAAAFATTAIALRRRGFRVAAALVATLAVCMTPVWSFGILRLIGEWPPPVARDPLVAYEPYMATRWMVLELATLGVALAVVRHVRSSVLAVPIAAAFVALLIHVGQALGNPRFAWYVGPYYLAAAACLVLAIAYLVDRHQPEREDYALSLYVAGELLLLFAHFSLWRFLGAWRHALPVTAAAFLIAALYLRRRVLLAGAGVAALGYLTYLSFDVFRRVVALPVALAGLGLVVIVATVWAQRRFPALVERIGGRDDDRGRKRLPTHLVAAFAPFAIAVTAMLLAAREAEERTVDREFREELLRQRAHNRAEPVTPPGRPMQGRRP